jgi:hypothetical protein
MRAITASRAENVPIGALSRLSGGLLQRSQGNRHASSRRHSGQAERPEKIGTPTIEVGGPMPGQDSTKLPRVGYSRYSTA